MSCMAFQNIEHCISVKLLASIKVFLYVTQMYLCHCRFPFSSRIFFYDNSTCTLQLIIIGL